MDAGAETGKNSVSKHTRFGLSLENEQAEVGRDSRTRLVRLNSQARTRTGKHLLSLFS